MAHKYEVILGELTRMIDAKTPGERIPTESELAARFSVSAMTVRRALQILSDSGRLAGIPGRGTFVTVPRVARPFTSSSFTETMRASGRVASTRLIEATISPARPGELELLDLGPDAKVYRLTRLRYGNEVPLCVEHATLAAAPFPGLLGHDLEGSLYEILRTKYATEVTQTRFDVVATLPDAQTAQLLGIAQTQPCLETTTSSRNRDGLPIEHTVSTYRGDIYHLTFEPSAP